MVNVYYSISPFGTGDIKTGTPNIEITSGVATLSVAQTGNIGMGTAIEYNSTVCYISVVNSPTSFDVITATGGTPTNQESTAVTSIHHVFASRSDFESNYLGASYINNADLTAATTKAYCCSYYDHDDYTTDSSSVNWSGATTDADYHVVYMTPTGGTQSINNQRHLGKWDTTKYYCESELIGSYPDRITDSYVEYCGIQIHNTDDTSASSFCMLANSASVGLMFDSCIFNTPQEGNGFRCQNASITATFKNTIFFHIGTQGSSSEGFYAVSADTINLYYCLSYNHTAGFQRAGGTINATNCISFGNNDDFAATITCDYCASEDGDGTNAVTLNNGTYAYSNIWTDYANGDFSLVNDTSNDNAPQNKGTPIGGITVDIIGTSRDATNPDIGPFEFVVSGGNTIDETDTATLSDSLVAKSLLNRIFDDTSTISDSLANKSLLKRQLDDASTLSDSLLLKSILKRALEDTANLSENILLNLI